MFLSQRAVPHGDNAVLHTGYQLGTVYRSQAVIANDEAAPVPELVDYVESTVPGVRAPHAWLRDASGQRSSTVDLWGRRFVLIGHEVHAHWMAAAENVARAMKMELPIINVAKDGAYRPLDAKFEMLYETNHGDVILVRPDGFVAAKLRARDLESATRELKSAIQSILGISVRPEMPTAFSLA